jgi:hypothetical protein
LWLRVVVPVFACFSICIDVEFSVKWKVPVRNLVILMALDVLEAVLFWHLQRCDNLIDHIPIVCEGAIWVGIVICKTGHDAPDQSLVVGDKPERPGRVSWQYSKMCCRNLTADSMPYPSERKDDSWPGAGPEHRVSTKNPRNREPGCIYTIEY